MALYGAPILAPWAMLTRSWIAWRAHFSLHILLGLGAARQGKQEEAAEILSRVEGAFGELGIYPEEVDPVSGAAR